MEEEQTKKSLKYSVYDGASFAVMDGMTASFITPFAVAMNASVHLIAALTYIPQLLGAFIQLFAARLVEIAKDRKRILVVGSFIHSFLWLPLLIMPFTTPNLKFLIVIYVSLQTLVAQLMTPIGNAFLGDIVPKFERGRFFGVRNRVVGVSSFIAALCAGFILNHFSVRNPFIGFSILFGVAFIGRFTSAIFKSMIHNPEPQFAHEEKFSIVDFVKRMEKTNYGHFVIYISLFKFAVSIASPFFAVYMLKDLGFSYIQFTSLIASELVASFIAMGIWGRQIDSKGTKHVLYICGLLTPIIPFLWLFSQNFYYLILIEAFSGAAWAGFNLSASNFIFDAVRPENRVRCIAYYKFFEGITIFFGAALGGFLIDMIPRWIFTSSIPFVFIISGFGRLAASFLLLPSMKEARLIELGFGHSFFKRYITVRPSEGILYEVIGKYRKQNGGQENKMAGKKTAKPPKQKSKTAVKEPDIHNKRLLKFIEKSISPKKDRKELTNMHEIQHIAEEIEKGKLKK